MIDQFKIEWYSGTGKGGQHRNKHKNCCRVTHLETGITAVGTASRSRETNKRNALAVCRARVAASRHQDTERYRAGSERIRTYHAERNEVIDHASGQKFRYTAVMENIGAAVDARRAALSVEAETREKP